MMDLNHDGPARNWLALLAAAEANAETEFEIEFCASLREKLDAYGDRARLTPAQEYKLHCIAEAGGFWERSA
ncbi:MAG: hypothetical protein AB1781_09990 [Pseudomonadota bacterium]